MIVDMFGPPGSGKSFLAPQLAAEHKVPQIRLRFGQKYALALMFFVTQRPLAMALFRQWDSHTREFPLRRRIKLRRLISFVAKEQKARLKGGGVVDEGIFQYLLVLHEAPVVPAQINAILRHMDPADHLVCIVETRRETRIQRMIDRGKVSRGELGEDYQRKWQAVLAANADALAALFRKRFRCQTVKND